MDRRTLLLAISFVLCAGSGAMSAHAGDLNPPPGPVAPTMKPLTDVEPRVAINATNTPGDADSLFKIAQPGSYYLTGNVTGEVGKVGIKIAVSGVTVDLMGYELAGVPDSLEGIRASVFNTQRISIRNGAVHDWGRGGIDLGNSDNNQLTDLSVEHNTFQGIFANNATTVTHCVSFQNGTGIQVNNAGVITGCSIYDNLGAGLSANLAAVVTDCTAYSNGLTGITAAVGSTITACSAQSNGSRGIAAGNGSTITDCTASFNTSDGLSGNKGCTLTHCTSHHNAGAGFIVLEDASVIDCTAYDNTGSGIFADNVAATVSGCTATSNDGHGISIGSGLVTGCRCDNNVGDGIRVIGSCQVTENKSSSNGANGGTGAGIHVIQENCRVEGNFVSFNDLGIDVDSLANVIIHNIARANGTNYDVPTGNLMGTIIHIGVTDMNAATNTYGNLSL